ncbi:MAG: methyltransferase domain-containing protein [Candidatus Viridilinea halotolerans]|uniref:Methyltransferase domain-containing protein n=1 Tax=Candidatus Viridilinea halotolerans TaxID=2491704 RepID=A0A426U4C1_9CHLR|nr:MAG: methyltransferase domain-containing protein [Candidatus Viridilinea halotolerans]
MFHHDYPVDQLRPAPYNPRRLDEAAFLALQRAIRALGMLKPIIVADNGTIIAGHQRTRALQAIGQSTAPAYVITGINTTDEIRFNQLHNGTDLDTGDEQVTLPPSTMLGYVDVDPRLVSGALRSAGATLRHAMCSLLTLYGPWGGVVATQSGTCLSGAQYALACKLVNMPIRVYYVADQEAMRVRAIFGKQYGTFSYDHLPKTTYAQTFAQMYRVRTDQDGAPRGVRAPNYDRVYIPNFRDGERILDFGCGQGDYVRLLQAQGVRIWGIEFYYRIGDRLNTRATHQMIDSLIATLREHGRFDTVICEFVLNSTDSIAAEQAVMGCLNAFCKPGGRIYASGRSREGVSIMLGTTADTQESGVVFLDAEGYSGKLLKGHWFYQKYHTKTQCHALGQHYLGPNHRVWDPVGMPSCFLLSGLKEVELADTEAAAALAFEFDLMWPHGRSVQREAEVLDAWRVAVARERERDGGAQP